MFFGGLLQCCQVQKKTWQHWFIVTRCIGTSILLHFFCFESRNFCLELLNEYVLYIFTRVWVLCTPNTGQNMLFQLFCAKKLKKGAKSKEFVENFTLKIFFSGNKILNQCSKLVNLATNFLLFSAFSLKKCCKSIFHQCLECAASKSWSKYTTNMDARLAKLWQSILVFHF